jgi:hypothetical protein
MGVKLDGGFGFIYTVSNPEDWKASEEILVTEFGIIIDCKRLQR